MTAYDNRNTFILFVNEKKNEKSPDRSGTFTDGEGVEWYMDGWIKQGAKGPFLSGRIKPKDAKVNVQQPRQKPAQQDDQDSIPF